jgi:hypothetical protein
MNTKLLFSAAALAVFAMASTLALAQSSGCMGSNCPRPDQASTTGQSSEKAVKSPTDRKTGVRQSDTTMKPSPQRRNPGNQAK